MTCVRQATFGPRGTGTGTCEGACRHYTSCKGTSDRGVRDACIQECTEIFIEDGEADTESLKEFERLSCEDAVAFVEGSSGRGPGEAERRARSRNR